MSDRITTVSGSFPVQDISHKPKRMQGDAIRQKYDSSGEDESLQKVSSPKVVTLERAINYYEELAEQGSDNALMYSATVKWLKELLTIRSSKTEAVVKALFNAKLKEEVKGEDTENR